MTTETRLKRLESETDALLRPAYDTFMSQFTDDELEQVVDGTASPELLARFEKCPPAPPKLQAEIDKLAAELEAAANGT